MDDYVPKPVKTENLEAVLDRWVSKSHEATVPEPGKGPDARESSAQDPIDRNVFAGLRQLQREGEGDILGELVELFFADVPPRLVALREAVRAGNARSVEAIAHAIKGGCTNMGAARMGAFCAELEEMGRSEDLAGAPSRMSLLEEEFGRVRVAFERELSEP
jgi:HPt (histidine-containing phosphotransfer) domain-containing protein